VLRGLIEIHSGNTRFQAQELPRASVIDLIPATSPQTKRTVTSATRIGTLMPLALAGIGAAFGWAAAGISRRDEWRSNTTS
jgi:hypothetical protein